MTDSRTAPAGLARMLRTSDMTGFSKEGVVRKSSDRPSPESSTAANQAGNQLARHLRDLRESTPLSLRDLERQTHVSDSSLSQYLTGRSLPPWPVVETIGRLGGGDATELRALWEKARIEQRRSRSQQRSSQPAAETDDSVPVSTGETGPGTTPVVSEPTVHPN